MSPSRVEVGSGAAPDPAYRPCVGVILTNPEGLVWAGQRIDSPVSSPAWQMPQGGIDKGEAPRAAALRELEEETGIKPAAVDVLGETGRWLSYDLPPDLAARMWKGRYKGQTQKWFHMDFRGADADINIIQPHQEFREWAWMDAGKLAAQIVEFKRQLYLDALGDFGLL